MKRPLAPNKWKKLFVQVDWVEEVNTAEEWNKALVDTLQLALDSGARLDSVERLPFRENCDADSYLIKLAVEGERKSKRLMHSLKETSGPGVVGEGDPDQPL